MARALVALFAWIGLVANIAVAVGTGIECGWQPMPGGATSYECVVQIAPELLDSLRRGDSIPLTLDVPEHIRPISRIRLVAGNESLPHTILASDLKPWPEAAKKSRDGIIETQFTTNGTDPRYNVQQATSGAVVPLSGYASDAQDAFARQLQNGGQAVREAVGQMAQDVLPPDPGRSVVNAVDRATNELGNNLRNASDSVQSDIRQLFGDEPTAGDVSAILPPGGQQPAALNSQQTLPILPGNSSPTGSTRRLDQPLPSSQRNEWQSSQQQTSSLNPNTSISSPRDLDPRWVGDTRPHSQGSATGPSDSNPVGDRYNNTPVVAPNSATVLPQGTMSPASNQIDRFGSTGQSASADSRNGALSGTQSASAGPSFPPFTPSGASEESPITPTPVSSVSTPAIRRDMFNHPANAEIQGANGLPIGQQPIANPQVAAQSPSTQGAPTGNSFNWNTQPQMPQTATPHTSSSGGNPNSVLPLVLSWVLLSGSGAGNLYLFWSYLDVRNKYRDLVDDASRRISGRRARD